MTREHRSTFLARFKYRSCDGKFKFESRAEGREGLKRMKAAHGYLGSMKVYKCEFCDGYHIGHRTKASKCSTR
jgi:hypothetical protein